MIFDLEQPTWQGGNVEYYDGIDKAGTKYRLFSVWPWDNYASYAELYKAVDEDPETFGKGDFFSTWRGNGWESVDQMPWNPPEGVEAWSSECVEIYLRDLRKFVEDCGIE